MSERTVTVCDKCFRASCWQSEFMCDEALTAGVVEKTIEELKKLSLENECYWQPELIGIRTDQLRK